MTLVTCNTVLIQTHISPEKKKKQNVSTNAFISQSLKKHEVRKETMESEGSVWEGVGVRCATVTRDRRKRKKNEKQREETGVSTARHPVQ